MQEPYLIIFAGCNGSGKSTFSKNYVRNIIPYDFDKRFKKIYDSLIDSELRHTFAKNKATKEFEDSINNAFSNRKNFSYETNFDSHPVFWAKKAKKLGYHIELHFYCLDSFEIAKERVFYRARNKGHFVTDRTIGYKWREGYKNLNLHFKLFDRVVLIDNSYSYRAAKNLFVLIKNSENKYEVEFYDRIPRYAKRRFPEIYEILIR